MVWTGQRERVCAFAVDCGDGYAVRPGQRYHTRHPVWHFAVAEWLICGARGCRPSGAARLWAGLVGHHYRIPRRIPAAVPRTLPLHQGIISIRVCVYHPLPPSMPTFFIFLFLVPSNALPHPRQHCACCDSLRRCSLLISRRTWSTCVVVVGAGCGVVRRGAVWCGAVCLCCAHYCRALLYESVY